MMEISSPRRILAVASADATQHLARVLKDLTGRTPEPTSTSLAGSSHDLVIKTAYYSATLPIWLDLISNPADWAGSFLSAEAKEVLEILGGVIVVFALPAKADSDEARAARDLIASVGKVVREGLGGWDWDGVGLCLGLGEIDDADAWEDLCAEWGLEFVQVRNQSVPGRNEFGEKTGIPRALEALEANDWTYASADDLGSEFGDFETEMDTGGAHPKDGGPGDGKDLDPENLDFGFDREDFAGLKRAIWSAGQEDGDGATTGDGAGKAGASSTKPGESLDEQDVQKVERMMVKLQAVRDTSAGLPEEQRKRLAAKAVGEVMKEL